jgi:GT2 family glycosyltransferase
MQSKTIRFLCFQNKIYSELISSLILYDNSGDTYAYSQTELKDAIKIPVKVIRDSSNPGIGVAYNYAYKLAVTSGISWLLLLDDDTILSKEYFNELATVFNSSIEKKIVSIVPKVVDIFGKQKISPTKKNLLGMNLPVKKSGITVSRITGINSGTLLKTDFLKSINGFSRDFPLDMLDHWIFRKIYQTRNKVYVMKSVIIHDLSLMNISTIEVFRYASILEAEKRYILQYASVLEKLVYVPRTFWRMFKLLIAKRKDLMKELLKIYGKQ